MPESLNLVVTDDRMQDMDLETFYNLEDSPKAIMDFVAHFVSEDGEYLPHKEAIKKVVKGRTLQDIEQIMQDLRDAMEASAVPNE